MMRARFLHVLLAATWCAAALPASAQLTVATDHQEYHLSQIIHLTIHNAGPHVAWFASEPVFTVTRLSSGECFYGCVGLPVLSELAAGATWLLDFDTAQCWVPGPGVFGDYRIDLTGSSGDPGSVLATTFRIYDVVDVQSLAWGTLKGTYR